MLRFSLIAIVLSCLLFGCASPNDRPRRYTLGDTQTLVMGGNLRVVTQTNRAIIGQPNLPTICMEPSPDVIIAFERTTDAKANVAAKTGLNGEQALKVETKETAAELTSRDKGVLALRDGLYAACQSYANGVLGHDAYALILSQYGNLLVALVGGDNHASPHRSSRDTALVGLMVACVSEHDPTRLRATDISGQLIPNDLLGEAFCRKILDGIESGRLLK